MRLNEFMKNADPELETMETTAFGIQYKLVYSDVLMKYGVYPLSEPTSLEDHNRAFISISGLMDQKGYSFDMSIINPNQS